MGKFIVHVIGFIVGGMSMQFYGLGGLSCAVAGCIFGVSLTLLQIEESKGATGK